MTHSGESASAPAATKSPRRNEVVINVVGAERLISGHLWVFRPQILRGEPEDGAVVRVTDQRGRFLGMAFHSAQSAIALRLLSRDECAIDGDFLRKLLRTARARREFHLPGVTAYRLVHGEADGLPGTIVDVYGSHLVLQTLTAGSEHLLGPLEEALAEVMAPDSILLRNDPAVRRLEGLPREVRQLRGTTPQRLHVREGSIHLTADCWHGQKTGLFLDQRENRIAIEALGGRQVLDCFSYEGAFALHAATFAEQVTAVDVSRDALLQVEAHAEMNGLANIRAVEGNAFDVLRSYAVGGQRFDLVILDPPAFAKNKAALEGALRGYKEINLRALKLLMPGGRLVTSSCSYHMNEQRFEAMLRDATADARRTVRVLARRGQAADHPVLLGVPETSYLKSWVLEAE
jgi:23S rRNA (cytosine1962-C5)-methyltransferase